MGELKHANPEAYTQDLKDALDEFEEALLWRYEADLDDETPIWTTHGYEPTVPADAGPGNRSGIVYGEAKKSAPEWAASGREWVRMMIVDYGTQNLNLLKSAFEDFHAAARLLGEYRAAGDDGNIPILANSINNKCDFATWAGASGEAFKNNFGESADPTMENQAKIATNLFNLYSARTCIIESARRNTINAFKRAADRLRETEDSSEENARWLFVGLAATFFGLALGPGGAALSVATSIGGFLDSEDPDQKFTNNIKGVVKQLVDDLGKAGSEANSKEGELFDKIIGLQKDLAGVKGKKLELYDFTGGDYSPAAPEGGFEVSADDVYGLSALCFEASREYEDVIAKVILTDTADSELKGEGHVETAADTELIDTKDTFLSFLKTTCARYYEAGERLYDTARDYFGVEADNEDIVKALEEDLDHEIDIEVGLEGRHRDPDSTADRWTSTSRTATATISRI